ncbi:protein adenylyltransferase SelO [Variovorax defluvii]
MRLLAEEDTKLADPGVRWVPGFSALGPAFYTSLRPTPLPSPPYWVGWSDAVAREIGMRQDWRSDAVLAALTGQALFEGSAPLATVYSGHQFGVWAGQLGDGRAILLGETDTGWELQLKGAGRTPYSRMGDGRAVLRSSIREFLCSEAVHALGIPTTRALCVTGSDDPVVREEIETAAVVTRAAPSFVRFGHFEHFAAANRVDELRALADYVIDRFYPACRHDARFAHFDGNAYAAFLEAVSERTAALLAQWQSVGFCHGVMNTDNMSILGLTIDYGPFQFLDGFDPRHICNHSDTGGRYAYNQQPNVAYWNLFCLAQALLPLIGDQEIAVAALQSYKTVFPDRYEARMRAKLGLPSPAPDDRALVEGILKLLAQEKVDYTIFWRRLADHKAGGDPAAVRDLFLDRAGIDAWLAAFEERHAQVPAAQAAQSMRRANPKFVLRNHLGQQAIEAAQRKDFSGVATLLELLQSPFEDHAGHEAYAGFPPDWASTIEISCSS